MKNKIFIGICLGFLLIVSYFNWKFKVIAVHPFGCNGEYDFKVLTWNIYCSEGADIIRQRKIAELILNEDADFVQLNEYNQDSCTVIDSLLKIKYPFTEEYQSHQICGDIFYSKQAMTNSGHVYTPKGKKGIQTIKATIRVASDSVHIMGVHMASNRYDGFSFEKELQSDTTSYEKY